MAILRIAEKGGWNVVNSRSVKRHLATLINYYNNSTIITTIRTKTHFLYI
jgi:hypothetical protein